MSNNKHRVSIGMPVYNGEQFLKEALDSILAQTFEDFELIISDNASTDSTQKICREYAAQDRRIRYYRNEQNIGVSNNFNCVFELSTGEYFRWAAHDDLLAPALLSRCVTVLDQDSSIVMCYSKTARIDEHGAVVGNYDSDMKVASLKPHERFRDLICVNHSCISMFGVVRASALRMTQLIANYRGSDWNMLAELGLMGRLYEIPEYLFFRRDHPHAATKFWGDDPEGYQAWFDPAKAGQISFPHWRRLIEYFVSIRRVPLTLSERLLCYAQIGRWLVGNSHSNQIRLRLLASDLKIAVKQTRLKNQISRKGYS